MFLVDGSVACGRVFRECIGAIAGETAIGVGRLGVFVGEEAVAFVNVGELDLGFCECLHVERCLNEVFFVEWLSSYGKFLCAWTICVREIRGKVWQPSNKQEHFMPLF